MQEEVNKKEVEEEQTLTILTERRSPCRAVAWELCSSESHGQPDVSETQYRTQLTDSQDKASIKRNDARERDIVQTVDVERFHVEDDQQKGDRIQSLHTDGWGKTQESGGCLDNRSLNSNEDTGAEESAAKALPEGDRQRMDKTSIKGKTTEGEHDTMSQGDKAELEKEDCDIRLCLRQEEEDTEEKRLQRNTAVQFLASEKKEESPVSEQQVRNQLFSIIESADDKLHHKNRNLPEGQVVIFGKPDNAANFTGMQSNDDKRERSGVMGKGNPALLTPTRCSVSERLIPEVQAEQEKHSCEIEVEEFYKETSHTSVTVNSINNVGQETSREVFKNVLRGICEGQQGVSQGLNPPPSEEVQRGFPEHNNVQRQDQNPTQGFLEEQDPEECQTVFLPEEMEDKQSMQNNCSSTGSDYLVLTECVVEEQKTKDNIQEGSDLTSGDHRGLRHLTDAALLQEKEPPLVESGKQEILFHAVRTGIKDLEEEPEATSKEPRGGTEELLAEIEENDACEVHTSTQEVVMFTGETVKFFEDTKQEMAETSSRSPSLLEDFSEPGLVRQEAGTEPTCLEENTGEIQDVGLTLEEFGFKDDNIASKDKSKSKNEKQILNLSVASLSESITDTGNNLVGESEAQQSKAISNDTASKSTAKDMTVMLAEETEKHATMIYIKETSLNSAQELIDEDTTDPWIQMFLSKDTDGIRGQEEPESGQQMGWKTEPLTSEGDENSSDLTESEDQFVKLSQSGGSKFRSDAGMSSCTEQSAFGDDAHCESGAPKGESHLWTLNITGSPLGTTSDMLESDVSKMFIPEPTTESWDILMKEITEIQQLHPREAGHLNQEMVESQGNFTKESGSQSDVDHSRQTNKLIQSSTEMDTSVQVTSVNEDILKDIAANSGHEVEDAGSGPSRSSYEVSLEEENALTKCAQGQSQGGTESSRLFKLSLIGTPQVGLSEDYVDALPRLNRTQVTTHLTEGSRNQLKVLFHNLYIYI